MKKLLLSLLVCCLALPLAADNLTVGGQSRSYNVYAPKNLGENRPLLIFCHGYNQDANWMQNSEFKNDNVSMEAVCDTAKFVVVFPNGIDKAWDVSGDRDINFIKAIIDKMATQYNIDRKRVYLGGFSMGGMLTYHAMNKIPDLIAAFCPVSGYPMGGATASAATRPLPIIHIHGTDDTTCGFSGVQPALDVWIKHNACPTTLKVVTSYNGLGLATRRTWGPGNNGVEVSLIELKGKGHWVSKEPQVYTGSEIWKFCSRFSLDLKDPTVQLTSPASGLTYITLGGEAETPAVTLKANADDPDGQVASVAFYDGSTLLATVTEAPYTCTVSTLTKGTHTLKAVATDDEGRTATASATVKVEQPTGAYQLHKTFTTENSMPEGWASYDGAERRTGFSSGFGSGCRVFRFTSSKRDFDWGLYARNTTGARKAGYVRFADKSTTTTLTLHPGIYELTYKVSNWNRADFSPVTVVVETAGGQEIFSNTFTPTANVGNAASNAFSGTTQLKSEVEVLEKSQYTVTFYTADQGWADLVVGTATLAYKSALPTGNQVIDISGNNTSSSYVSYDNAITLPAGKAIDVRMARYCYFSPTINGGGTLNLYAGGERDYLGTASGKTWPNWAGFTGDIHIYPFPENSSADFYGVVLAHGGKSSTPDNALSDVQSGKVNTSMENNRVFLHQGATICTEANTSGAGFRIGELHTETGSTLRGYMKKDRATYYLLGHLNSSATLAGTLAPTDYQDNTALGIVKEGSGTYRITGNNNYLSGALRVVEGRVQIANDRAEAEAKKLRGALGARPSDSDPIAYVFEQGLLGGTGSIGGTVDNYGTVEPGDFVVSGDEIGITSGTLTLRNYVTPSKKANLLVRPASKLHFKVFTAREHDLLDVGGDVKYINIGQDFAQSNAMPVIEVSLIGEDNQLQVGDELTLLTAQGKATQAGDWHFELKQPARYTWELVEHEADGQYTVALRLVSRNNPDYPDNPDNPDNPDTPETQMGPYYDDGINDQADANTLRHYADKNGKHIGVALSTWKAGADEAGQQFNMLVAENEMKMDALQPQRGTFSFGAADNLVSIARQNGMAVRGHCLVWHMQQPEWVSSDGKKNDRNWSRTEALSIMKDHINAVMQHFKGQVTEWDVVNECLDDDQAVVRTNPDGYNLRPTVWQRAIGDDYIDSAFVYAHRADPTARLFLNDYDVELQGNAKAVAFFNLIARLRKSQIPVDGAGLQCHFSVGDVDSVKLDRTIRRFGEAGVLCSITELDMGIASTAAADLEEQARCYRVVTDIMLNNDNCQSMVVWGVKDNDSWRSSSSPLLYDAGLGRKAAWYAVRSALRHRTLTTGVGPVLRTPETDDKVYDLLGRRVTTPLRPGLYLQGGRKIVIR